MDITPVDTKTEDFLDQDPPIRGQNFVCMSFISPEDTLKNKEIYTMSKFLSGLGQQLNQLLEGLESRFPDEVDNIKVIRENYAHFTNEENLQSEYKVFTDIHSAEIEKEFYEKNNFRTSIRGFKVRGVYDTQAEATHRAQTLKKQGDKFDIFVAQVGCWCPWSPNPSDLQDVEYAETQLNTLMKGYMDNAKNKDAYYELRKNERMEAAQKQLEVNKKRLEELKAEEEAAAAAAAPAMTPEEILDQPDPWMQSKGISVEESTEPQPAVEEQQPVEPETTA